MALSIEEIELYEINSEKRFVLVSDMTNNKIVISLPPQVKHNEEKMKRKILMKKFIFDELIYFSETIKTKMPHFNLSTFFRNNHTLKVKIHNNERSKRITKNSGLLGAYSSTENAVHIYSTEAKRILPHELLHMATSYMDKSGVEYSGFCQKNHKTKEEVGRGISEGYTALINRRYFPNTNNGYQLYQSIMEIIEGEIGQKETETLYSKMDLNGLLEKAKEHGIYEPFVRIIKCIDFFELLYAEKCDPLKYFKPEYEDLSDIEIGRIIADKVAKRKIMEQKLIEAATKLISIIISKKISRNEISYEESLIWKNDKISEIDFYNQRLRYIHLSKSREIDFDNSDIIKKK